MSQLDDYDIQVDDEGFPKSNEFFFPILKIIEDNNFTEEEIIEKLKDYFNFSEELINQKVVPRNETNKPPTSKLQSRAHFAIANFEILNFIKKENSKYYIQNKGKYVLKKNIFRLNKTHLVKISGKLDLTQILSSLSNLNLDMTFFHLTKTGKEKNNIDATEHIRHFLKRNDLHDYESQRHGVEFKKFIKSIFFREEKTIEFKTSLYRANTRGDCRFGLINLNKKLLNVGSLFLICEDNGKLLFFDLSNDLIKNSLLNKKGKYYKILKKISDNKSHNELKLLDFFKRLNQRKYILLNEQNPSIESILGKEDLINSDSSNEFSYDYIKFKVCDTEPIFNINQEMKLKKRLPCKENFKVLSNFKQNFFPSENNLRISHKTRNGKLKLEFNYLTGCLKVVNGDINKDIFSWNLENLLKNDEKFYITFNNIEINELNYILFDKLFVFSNPNFSLLSFFILDKDIESNLGISIELILNIEINEDFQNFSLNLKISDEKIIKDIFTPQIYE